MDNIKKTSIYQNTKIYPGDVFCMFAKKDSPEIKVISATDKYIIAEVCKGDIGGVVFAGGMKILPDYSIMKKATVVMAEDKWLELYKIAKWVKERIRGMSLNKIKKINPVAIKTMIAIGQNENGLREDEIDRVVKSEIHMMEKKWNELFEFQLSQLPF